MKKISCLVDSTGVLIPVNVDDKKTLVKLIGKIVNVAISLFRDNKNNSRMWLRVAFFMNNIPERYEQDFKGKTKEYIYKWLKMAVGYVEPLELCGVVYQIPRDTDFNNQSDEIEYMNEFMIPASEKIAEMMGYISIYELDQAIRISKIVE